MLAWKTARKVFVLLLVYALALWGVSLAYGEGANITQDADTAATTQDADLSQEASTADAMQEEDVAQDADTTQDVDTAATTQDADLSQEEDTEQEAAVLAASDATSTYSIYAGEGIIGDAAYLEDATGIAGTSTVEEGQLIYDLTQTIYDDYTIVTVFYSISLSQMLEYQMSNPYLSEDQRDTVSYYLDPSNFSEDSSGFYQFLDLRTSETSLTAAELDAYINSDSRGASGSLAGTGQYFIEAAQEYGINEVYLLAHAIHETGWGTSTLSQGFYYEGGYINGVYYPAGTYYNFYGIGAYDSDALSSGQVKAITEGWNSKEAAIKGAAEWLSENYIYYSGSSYLAQYTLYDMRWAPEYSELYGIRCWHQYATSVIWAERISYFMYQCYTYTGTSPSSAIFLVPSYQ